MYALSIFILSVTVLTAFSNYWVIVTVALGVVIIWVVNKSSKLIIPWLLSCILAFSTVIRFHHTSHSPCSERLTSHTWTVQSIRSPWIYEVRMNKALYLVTSNHKTIDAHLWDIVRVKPYRITCAHASYLSRTKIRVPPQFEEFDYTRRMWTRWYAWSIQWSVLVQNQSQHSNFLSRLRKRYIDHLSTSFRWDTLWLLIGMSVGWRAYLSDQQYDTYVQSWLVHLIAVSWSNITFIAILFSYCLFRLPLKMRRIVLIPCVIWYALLCWSDSSIMRALVFGLLGYVTIMGGVRISRMRMILYTVSILAFLNPYSLVYDVWLQLSLFAVWWIRIWVMVIKIIPFELPKLLTTRIIPTFTATLWVTPVLLLTFWSLNLTSMLATLLVSPIVAPINILLLSTLIPRVQSVAVWLLQRIVYAIERVAQLWVQLSVLREDTSGIWVRISFALCIAYVWCYQYANYRLRRNLLRM